MLLSRIINYFRDKWRGVPLGAMGRSPEWPEVRAEYLRQHPYCAVTGTTKGLNVHHKKPFHLFPELELDPTNLITLSEKVIGGVSPHLYFGHLGNYSSYNENVEADAELWRNKLISRPT